MEINRKKKTNLLWIAIDRYRDRRWPALQNSVSSSETLEDTLKTHYGLTDSEITCLPNQQATLPEIERTLRSYLPGGIRKLDEDDQLIISFSGHGERDKLTSETAFIPYDADPESPTSWFRFNTLKPILKNIAAHHILVVSDSCFSGGVFRSQMATDDTNLTSADFARRVSAKRSRMMLSSGGDELVQDFGGTVGHSVFMDGLVHALKTPIEPWLLAEKLYHDTRNYVVLNAHQTPEFGYLHDSGHAGGQLLLSKPPTETLKPLAPKIAKATERPPSPVFDTVQLDGKKPVTKRSASASAGNVSATEPLPKAAPEQSITSPKPLDSTSEKNQTPLDAANEPAENVGGSKFKTKLILGAIAASLITGMVLIGSAPDTLGGAPSRTNGTQNPEALLVACDQEAGSSNFAEITEAVAFVDINASNAVPACTAALNSDPDNVRVMHQLARAYDKMARNTGQREWAEKAMAQYQTACAEGSPGSCSNAGHAFDDDASNDLIEKDFRRANDLFLRGCEIGNGTASANSCDQLALNYEFSKGVEQNYQEAAKFYQRACDLGSASGCDHLGDMYEFGKGIKQDIELAAESYRQACEQNFGQGCGHLADLHVEKSVETPNFQFAAEYFLKGCSLEQAYSCRGYANLNYFGDLGPQNVKAAAEYYLKSCELDDAESCGQYATILNSDAIGAPNPNSAAAFYAKSCQISKDFTCQNLALLHINGLIENSSIDEAIKHLRTACQEENRDGCALLAVTLFEERGDNVRSLMNETCEVGRGSHCEALAWLIADDRLPGGLEEAAYYFIRSLRKGFGGPFNTYSPSSNTYLIEETKYRALVRELQKRMKSAGSYNGPSDGLIGPDTLAAARTLCGCKLALDY